MLSDEEQAAVRQSVDQVRLRAAGHLNADRSTAAVIGFVENLHRGVDAVAQRTAENGVRTDCKAGCAFCCRVRVEATEPEIFYIARALRKRPAGAIGHVVEQLRQRVATLQSGQATADCAFLDHNLCSIYEVRPAVCRKAHSLAVASCRSFAPEIPQSMEIVLGAEALMQGTSKAYREIGLPASGQELTRAMLTALTDASAEARWANGEDVFAA